MTFKTCVAGKNIPVRNLLKQIMSGRGHRVDDVVHLTQCPSVLSGQVHSTSCDLIVVEYSGPETVDAIDCLMERTRLPSANIALFGLPRGEARNEAQALGCHALRHPFHVGEFVDWVVACERRCTGSGTR